MENKGYKLKTLEALENNKLKRPTKLLSDQTDSNNSALLNI